MANYRKSFNFRNGVQVDDDNFIVRSSGLVGIGTSQPAENLDILGSARVSGLTTTNSLFARNGTVGVLTSTTLNVTNQTATNLLVSGIATVNGNITLGNNINVDVLTLGAKISGSIIPSSNGTLDLGSSSSYWNTIYANSYQNFALADLPTGSESTFAADRVLKVKSDGSGYELVDIILLNAYQLGGLGLSNDDTMHIGIGTTVSSQLQISGIATARFYVGERVKVFGITSFTDNTSVDPPDVSSYATQVGAAVGFSTYRYWIAQYDLRKGKVGVSSQIPPLAGIAMTTLDNFNEEEHISLTVKRTNLNYGVLVYRQVGVTTNIGDAKLIGILGPKEFGASSEIAWKDYGTYDQTEWSGKGTANEYTSNQIHFPNIATTGFRRGWAIDSIVSVGASSIRLSGQYRVNPGIGSVIVVHDNTYAFKTAINAAVVAGKNSIELPSGTYLTNNLTIPSGFTLSGNGKNTVIKQQYYATDLTDGAGNSLALNGNVIGVGTTGSKNITIQDLTIDGNAGNNILFSGNNDNYVAYFDDISSSIFKSIEIRNTPGDGLFIENSSRVSIENCSFVDGSLSDRYPFQPLDAQNSQSLRINDCLFENFPGPVDLSATSVVSTGGNIIRNCGTGLRVFATGKITTTNNIILGPSDEYIPTPDIYDSDYNSINLTVNRQATFNSPVLLYLEKGDPKDISSGKVTITAGIGTIVGQGTTNETLGTKFLNFNIPTPDAGTFGRENGYIQLSLTQTQASSLGLSSALGYDIIGAEWLSVPVGLTTTVGISTGAWNLIGAGATNYTVSLLDPNQFSAISTGDIVKLVDHSSSPDLSGEFLNVEAKIDGLVKQLRLSGFTTTSSSNGNASGYIYVRNIFTIAKGRVGVT